jgi:hypothetical protein
MVKELIPKGLMFGNLILVQSPALVERYNRALLHLTGQKTSLTEFHVDISGFSPEIGEEFKDNFYLNHAGLNRQFILLTTEQVKAPLLNASFSTSRGILRQFIVENEPQLFALTTRDAVAGELVNSVYRAETAAEIFNIRKITIEADTTDGAVATADKLGELIDQFKTSPDAWFDDPLIGQMIDLAKKTGDLTRNPIGLKKMSFIQDNFWTSLFGGLYLFRGVAEPAVISIQDKATLGPMPIAQILEVKDRTAIARFLQTNDLVETIVDARGVNAATILHQKMDIILADVASTMGERLSGITRRDLRQLERKYAAMLPAAWQGLASLARWAEDGGIWPQITSDHESFFYTLRAKKRPDADLVNMLLAELSPLDFRQLFVCHKEAFNRVFATWSPKKQEIVVNFLTGEFVLDNAGARSVLSGNDEALAEPQRQRSSPWAFDSSQPPIRDIIDLVGPWGAVIRK